MLRMNTPRTKNIRVTVPVSPEVLELFRRLSVAAGQSVGRAMADWLEETKDGLEPMIDILEHHKKAPKKAIQSIQLYAGNLNDLTRDLFEKVQHMDDDSAQMGSVSAAARNVSDVLRKRGLTPPSSNTGGKGRKTAKTGGSK
jgi:hypothetical protein